MRMFPLAAGLALALAACTQPAAQKVEAAPTDTLKAQTDNAAAAPAPAASWSMPDGDVLRLDYTAGDVRLRIDCPEGRKQLTISAAPLPPGEALPLQARGAVTLGAKTYPVTFVQGAGDMTTGIVASIKADADSVTALMMAETITVTLAQPAARWTSAPAQNGEFDIAGTTCAQINGLR